MQQNPEAVARLVEKLRDLKCIQRRLEERLEQRPDMDAEAKARIFNLQMVLFEEQGTLCEQVCALSGTRPQGIAPDSISIVDAINNWLVKLLHPTHAAPVQAAVGVA